VASFRSKDPTSFVEVMPIRSLVSYANNEKSLKSHLPNCGDIKFLGALDYLNNESSENKTQFLRVKQSS
jgi:hypothetical protein